MWKRKIAKVLVSASAFLSGALVVFGIEFGSSTECTNRTPDPGTCARAGWISVLALAMLGGLVGYVMYGKRFSSYAKPLALLVSILFVGAAQTLVALVLLR